MKKDPLRRQVLRVKGCFAGSKTENLLEQGDMVLAINKQPVTCFRDIEDACQSLDHCTQDDGKLDLTIFRQVSKKLSDISFTFFNFSHLSIEIYYCHHLFTSSKYKSSNTHLDSSFIVHGFSGKRN